jgi:UDP-N-acetylglucosamine 2-epimerase (non-hydrolysing)
VNEPIRAAVVIGTRPEAVKMAPVVRALRACSDEVALQVVLTGQHGPMVHQTLEVFGIRPDRDLEIMTAGQSLYDVGHRCMNGMRDLVREIEPEILLVQGDTATVFYASLVGYFEQVMVGHVEAGLRSGDRYRPFPEEMFRRMTDTLSSLHFAPTREALENLLAEGIDPGTVFVTGNTVVDALIGVSGSDALPLTEPVEDVLQAIRDDDGELVLLTAHRRESFGAPIRDVFSAVRALAEARKSVHIVLPMHPNPEVRGAVAEVLEGHPRIHLLEPVPYVDLVGLLREADLVLTDSGGIQEEAPTFGVPVLVLRSVTERPEGVRAGVATLVGTDPDVILQAALGRLTQRAVNPLASARENPYGDGLAGERIADLLLHQLRGRPRRTTDWQPQ